MSIIEDLRRFHASILRHSDCSDDMKHKQVERSEGYIGIIKQVQIENEELQQKYEQSMRVAADLRKQRNIWKEQATKAREAAKKQKDQNKMERAFAAEALHQIRCGNVGQAEHIMEKFQENGHSTGREVILEEASEEHADTRPAEVS